MWIKPRPSPRAKQVANAPTAWFGNCAKSSTRPRAHANVDRPATGKEVTQRLLHMCAARRASNNLGQPCTA